MSIEIEVTTKDCTGLSDSELAEMADMCTGTDSSYEIGFLSKQLEAWVLVTQARESSKLRGFILGSLERIGGTPSLLVGVASFVRTGVAEQAMKGAMSGLYRRALLAFPDEDVLVGTRMLESSAFRAFGGLDEIVPRLDHRASGEERAWGRRLAKRFGAEGRLDDRTFVLRGDGDTCGALDFTPRKCPKVAADFESFFELLDRERKDSLVAFGWAMAEDLAAERLPR